MANKVASICTKKRLQGKSLTPEEAQEVFQLSFMYDMPTLVEYALAFALFKTYAIVLTFNSYPRVPLTKSAAFHIQASFSYKAVGIDPACSQTLCGCYVPKKLSCRNSTWMACPLAGPSIGAGPGAPADNPGASIALAHVDSLHSKYKIIVVDPSTQVERRYLFTPALLMFKPKQPVEFLNTLPESSKSIPQDSPVERRSIVLFPEDTRRLLNERTTHHVDVSVLNRKDCGTREWRASPEKSSTRYKPRSQLSKVYYFHFNLLRNYTNPVQFKVPQ
ncbi:hypothetical protein DFH09DRAFT_1086371 [Mycena vulgaris]|nr:hypothetical protein DFH09DRAFT_1086371 [Mycena vulgaris]